MRSALERLRLTLAAALVVSQLVVPLGAFAEVIYDGTIGPNAPEAEADGAPDYVIDEVDGELIGNNLFHSFLAFRLAQNESATFTASSPVAHVFSRVTGGDPSEIRGRISSLIPGADLYFLNPRGFLFADGAELDTQGAVYVASADSIRFDEPGGAVYLRADAPAPTLSMAPPAAFGFDGGAPAADVIVSLGGNLDLPAGQRFVMLGGDVEVRGTDVVSEGGEFGLVAVGEAAVEVPLALDGWHPREQGLEGLGEVRVVQEASLNGQDFFDAEQPQGRAVVRGGRVVIQDSQLFLGGEGSPGSLAMDIEATDAVSITGGQAVLSAFGRGIEQVGGIRVRANEIVISDGTRIVLEASGGSQGGDIDLAGDSLRIERGSEVLTNVLSDFESGLSGLGGDVTVEAGALVLADVSTLGTRTESDGPAGSVSIQAGTLSLEGGAQVTATTVAGGAAGAIDITESGSVTLEGAGANGPSGLFARSGLGPGTTATGDAGNITVRAREMRVRDGAAISARTFGAGNAGAIDLGLDGSFLVEGGTAGIASVSARGEGGKAGDVAITAARVILGPGGEVAAEALGAGDAGSVTLDAGSLLAVRGGRVSTRLALPGSNAQGGAITLKSGGAIVVSDGGRVSSFGASIGSAGDILLTTPAEVRLVGNASVFAGAAGAGNAGRIDVYAGQGLVMEHSLVSSESLISSGGDVSVVAGQQVRMQDSAIRTSVVVSGPGSGGYVDVAAPAIALNDSVIFAKADAGPGGNIQLTADGVVLSARSELNANSARGDVDGEILVSSPATDLLEGLTPLPERILDADALLAERCAARGAGSTSQFVLSGRGGVPAMPGTVIPAAPAIVLAAADDDRSMEAARAAGPVSDASVEIEAGGELRRARAQLAAGRFARAAVRAEAAVEAMARDRDEPGRVEALLALGAAQQGLGAYGEAARTLEDALSSARAGDSGARVVRTLASLGDVRIATGPLATAERLLDEAVVLARDGEDDVLLSRVLLALGNLRRVQARDGEALALYREAVEAAERVAASDDRARGLVSAARAAHGSGEGVLAARLAEEAGLVVASLPESHARTLAEIHLARTFDLLAAGAPETAVGLRTEAVELLARAERASSRRDDGLDASFAAGYLGSLYESAGRGEEALALSRRAATLAATAGANESLYLWQWQAGRILASQGHRASAIDSYERARASLETIRFDLPVRYGAEGSSFNQAVAPLYDGLVDLLLREAAAASGAADGEPWLRRARGTLEALRVAELRDYFHDECVDAQQAKLRSVDEASLSALIVYPVLLPDRVELLLTLPGGRLTSRSVDVSGEDVREDLRRLRRLVTKRSSREYLRPARRLYDVLVRPYERLLSDEAIDTIVFVPDGALATVPPGVFEDGERHLVERYAVALTPGLQLSAPAPLAAEGRRYLLAGLSESVQGFPALPNVKREIGELQEAYGGRVLLDGDFRVDALRDSVVERDWSVVHIATHAEFHAAAQDSFLLAWDGRIGIGRLEEYVGRFRHREVPLELLTLSACQTAEGSERAALGLSGVAVRAGARSVLGTLWPVQDEATGALVLEFYRELIGEGASRADALRGAQLALQQDPRFRHPAYWSAFVLIGSWL